MSLVPKMDDHGRRGRMTVLVTLDDIRDASCAMRGT